MADVSKPTVLVSHSGKQHAYRHAAAVARCGTLDRFVTSGYYRPTHFPDRWLARFRWLDQKLRRRHLSELDGQRVSRRWDLELPELLARGIGGSSQFSEHLVFLRDARFDHWVSRRWAAAADIFWGFQGSCLESLKAARDAGRTAVVEFATAHVTLAISVLSEEARRHPEWAATISNFNFPDWYRDRLEREPGEADICVAASQFTRRSLIEAGVPAEHIRMLPLGFDVDHFTPVTRPTSGPFRILFVGGIGQRKGIKYLLEAYRRIRTSNTELALVGPMMGNGAALETYAGEFVYLGRLDQADVVREMQRSHVLVLPSVFEGFGLVIPEAMATGMPVIASSHTIGPEIIEDGQEGFLLAPDDIDGLASRLEWLATCRERAAEMGRLAAVKASTFSWQAHTKRLSVLLNELADRPPEGLPQSIADAPIHADMSAEALSHQDAGWSRR